jgi:lipopolysaccharide export system protein LptA
LPTARPQITPAQPPAQFGAARQKITQNGVRLEGNAFIKRPELEVKASTIALDYNTKSIQEVRARGNVYFKVNLPPRGGGAPALIEARAAEADLDPATRTLVLRGNVSGFYQIAGGGRNSLSGQKVTLTYIGQQLTASSEGSVRVVLPAETINQGQSGSTTALGSVVITAAKADVNGQNGSITFSGNARALSTDGPNKFDFSAPSFILTRGPGGTIDVLKSNGRTRIGLDLPPDPQSRAANVTATATTPGNTQSSSGSIGKPTRVEAEANAVTVTRASNTLVLEGDVKGFYRLQPAGQSAGDYPFAGDRVVVRYDAEAANTASPTGGFQLDVSGLPGAPSVVSVPSFDVFGQ